MTETREQRIERLANHVSKKATNIKHVPNELRAAVLTRVEQMKAEAWARSDAGKNSANIDYIAMMTGVELPEDDE